MNHTDLRAHSLRLLSIVQNSHATDVARAAAFEELLDLPGGFWQRVSTTRQETLKGFVARIARRALALAKAMGMVAGPIDSRDIAQEVMLTFVMNVHKINNPCGSWFITVAARVTARSRRREARLPRATKTDIERVAGPSIADTAPSVAAPAKVQAAVRALPEKLRSVVQHQMQGHTAVETAKHLGLQAATVRQRLTRARAHLRRTLRAS